MKYLNGKQHTCLWNLGILLAEGTSAEELTLPKLAGREKLPIDDYNLLLTNNIII